MFLYYNGLMSSVMLGRIQGQVGDTYRSSRVGLLATGCHHLPCAFSRPPVLDGSNGSVMSPETASQSAAGPSRHGHSHASRQSQPMSSLPSQPSRHQTSSCFPRDVTRRINGRTLVGLAAGRYTNKVKLPTVSHITLRISYMWNQGMHYQWRIQVPI